MTASLWVHIGGCPGKVATCGCVVGLAVTGGRGSWVRQRMTKKVRLGIQVPGGRFPHLWLGRVSRDLRLAMRLCLPGGPLAVPAVNLAGRAACGRQKPWTQNSGDKSPRKLLE